MGNPEYRNMPPIPDSIKKTIVPGADEETELKYSDVELIEEIPDLTSEAVEINEEKGSPEVREALADVARIQEKRVGEKETLRAAHEALKLSEETGKMIEANKKSEELKKIAKARQELMDVGIISKNPEEDFQKHLAARLAESSKPGTPAPVMSAEKFGLSAAESSRDFMRQDVEAMGQSIKEKFGVDVEATASKGFFGKIGMGFRSLANRELGNAMAEYRQKLDLLNKVSDTIDEENMTKEDWARRADRAVTRPKPASPGAGTIGRGGPK